MKKRYFSDINKKGAMEMSVGTIVTIVLLMSVLVLGIFLIQNIFDTGTSAVEDVNQEVESQINTLFSEEGKKLALYPPSAEISIKGGDNPSGFAFAVHNQDSSSHTYTYETKVEDVNQCEGNLEKSEVESWMMSGENMETGIPLNGGKKMDPNEGLVRFNVPEDAPPCPIGLRLIVYEDSEPFKTAPLFLTVE